MYPGPNEYFSIQNLISLAVKYHDPTLNILAFKISCQFQL